MIIPTEDLDAGVAFADSILDKIRTTKCCDDCGADMVASVETITLSLLARYADPIAAVAIGELDDHEAIDLVEGLQSMALVAAVVLRRLAGQP